MCGWESRLGLRVTGPTFIGSTQSPPMWQVLDAVPKFEKSVIVLKRRAARDRGFFMAPRAYQMTQILNWEG